jgi:hypothetical protein
MNHGKGHGPVQPAHASWRASHASSRIRTVCQETDSEMLYMGAERSAHMNPEPQNKTRCKKCRNQQKLAGKM